MNDEAIELIVNGRRLTGWPAGIVMLLCGILPWSLGIWLLICIALGQVKIVW